MAEENNYYAFGLKHEGYNVQGGNPAYGYGYIGKELQKETGMYDFGARMYMPDLGRWGVMDPLAEMMRRHSPYNYAYNNPVNFVDPDGMAPRRLAMAGEGGPLDYQQSPSYNPNWMGIGNNVGYGDSYGFGAVYSGGRGESPSFQFPKGQEKYYEKNYPAFYDLVKNILPKMVNDNNFMEALSAASGFSLEELKENFQYGKGAIVQDGGSLPFGDAEYPYARIQDKSLKNTISLDEKVLEWFEKANKSSNNIEGVTNVMWRLC